MTRKDFELIASVMRNNQPHYMDQPMHSQWASDCNRLADRFAEVNERFDRGKFLKACGL